ncbi:hypothetical protein PROCOU_17690 [Listeria rocourtiae FSL F6-920]|nr:hypothetical protein PROCOU_17690 [Listeria rocourtiae FSL F6-920]
MLVKNSGINLEDKDRNKRGVWTNSARYKKNALPTFFCRAKILLHKSGENEGLHASNTRVYIVTVTHPI